MRSFPRAMRGTTRRAVLAGGLAAVLTASLAACGSSDDEVTGGGVGTAEKPVSIRMIANDAFARQWQDQMVPEFNKLYPNIKVTIDGVPYGDLLAKEMLELTAPDPTYDLIVADDPWIPQLAKTGGLADLKGDLGKFTKADYDWDDFNTGPLAAGEWQGKQYSVPVRSNELLMFYNKTLYAKAGLPEPTPKLTWQQYLEQAPKLVQDTNKDGKPDAWAVGTYFTKDPLTPTIWQTILNSNGGQLLDGDNKPAFNTPAGVAALQTHIDLLKYAPPGAATYQFNEPLEAFRQGKTATMFMWGSVYKGTAVDPKTTTLKPEQVGIQVMPVGSLSAGAHRGMWTAAVAKKSKQAEASWTLLQWLSSKQGEQWQSNTLGVFPARKSTLSSTPQQEWLVPVFKAIADGYVAIDAGKMWRPKLPESDAIQQILATQTSRAMSGQATAEQALQTAADEVSKLLKSKGY
ncbi:ABC transporter substrate-binding protein [Micromonospora rubida]|uniref:ABC transporter substrate-binding protein n=1 Tax=Micromonospora rubida TaxID=2697657 RepID=UPI00191C1DD2|nr:sugar ABC transporter substrate-binding protein [Micromonospora rubida]